MIFKNEDLMRGSTSTNFSPLKIYKIETFSGKRECEVGIAAEIVQIFFPFVAHEIHSQPT